MQQENHLHYFALWNVKKIATPCDLLYPNPYHKDLWVVDLLDFYRFRYCLLDLGPVWISGCWIWIFTPPQGWLHRKGSPSLRKSAVGSEVLGLWPQLGTHQKWTWRWKLPAKLWKHPQPTTKRWPQKGSKRLLNKNLQHPNLLVYVWFIDLYRLLRPCSKNISIICFLKLAWHTMLQKSGGFLQRRLVLQQLAERYFRLEEWILSISWVLESIFVAPLQSNPISTTVFITHPNPLRVFP